MNTHAGVAKIFDSNPHRVVSRPSVKSIRDHENMIRVSFTRAGLKFCWCTYLGLRARYSFEDVFVFAQIIVCRRVWHGHQQSGRVKGSDGIEFFASRIYALVRRAVLFLRHFYSLTDKSYCHVLTGAVGCLSNVFLFSRISGLGKYLHSPSIWALRHEYLIEKNCYY